MWLDVPTAPTAVHALVLSLSLCVGGFIPLIIAGAGMAISAIGKWKAGKAAKKEAEAEARARESEAAILDFNAHVADVQAEDAVERGREQESKLRTSIRGMIGSQRTGFAASGVDVGYGSSVDVQADTARLGELDALTVRTNAMREAWGMKVEAYDTRQRAKILREEGVQLRESGKRRQTSARIASVGGLATDAGNLLAARYGWGGKEG